MSCEYERQLYEDTFLPSIEVPFSREVFFPLTSQEMYLQDLEEHNQEEHIKSPQEVLPMKSFGTLHMKSFYRDETESSEFYDEEYGYAEELGEEWSHKGSIIRSSRSPSEYMDIRSQSLSHKILSLGDIGIICVDDLSPVYLRDLTTGGMNGQLKDIREALSRETGTLRRCRLILVVMPQPLIGSGSDQETPKLQQFRRKLRHAILSGARQWSGREGEPRRRIW